MNKQGYSAGHVAYLKKRRRSAVAVNVARVAILAGVLGAWELMYRLGVIDGFIFSAPSRIFATLGGLFASGEIYLHIGITLYETLAGFAIATVAGSAVALALWWNEKLRKILDPYIVVLNSLPKIALGPIIIIWFGSGTRAIIVMAVLIAVVVTTITMLGAFLETDADKTLLMRSMGATKVQILTKLVIPSSLAGFINMLKINIGMSWIGSIMGEYLVSKAGIGYLIVYGGQVFRLDLVYASTLILLALAAGMYALVSLAEKLIVGKNRI